MKRSILCVVFCAVFLCAVSGCYSSAPDTATASQTDISVAADITEVTTNEISGEDSVYEDAIASEEPEETVSITLPASSQPIQTSKEPASTNPQTQNNTNTEHNTGYIKTQEEADWLCHEFEKAVDDNLKDIQAYVDETYNQQIANLEGEIQSNNESCEVQIAILYRNAGGNLNNTQMAALSVQEQNIRSQTARNNNQIKSQIEQYEQTRDAYIAEHDTSYYVFIRMSRNTGLSIDQINTLMFDIYADEVEAYFG